MSKVMDIIGGVVSGMAGPVVDWINTKQTNDANKYMARYAYSKDLEMWNRQNEYNSPMAQMERLKMAGLNPNMIYGSGSASAGNATQLPRYNAPSMSYNYSVPNVLSVLSQFQDLKVKQGQVDNVAEQNRIYKATADIKEQEAKFAGDLFQAKAGIALESERIQKFKRIFSEEEFNRFFTVDFSKNKAYLRPEMEETFISSLSARWLKPEAELNKTQQDANRTQWDSAIRKMELEFLNSGGKFFNPMLQFLKFMRGY